MKVEDIKKVAVIGGAGMMGPGLCQNFAQAGCRVVMHDTRGAALKPALATVKSSLKSFVDNDILTADRADRALSLIETTTDLAEAAQDADFVLEAVYEDLDLKKEVFASLDALCPPHAILASNSSTYSVQEMANATTRPDRVILTHYLNPPHIIPLVEVVAAEQTSPDTLDTTLALLAKLGKKTVLCRKIIPGHLINAFTGALISTALNMIQLGAATREDIDSAITSVIGPRFSVMGPFQVMDLIGLDLMVEAAGPAANLDIFAPVKDLFDAGHYGVKTGRGFYDYSPRTPDQVRRDIDEKLFAVFKDALREAWGE